MKRLTTLLMLIALLHVSACQSHEQSAESAQEVSPADSAGAALLTEEDRGASVTLEEPLPLTYHFTKGDSFGYSITSVQNVKLDRDSVVENNRQELQYWFRFEVLEAPREGGGRIRVTCDRVTFAGKYESQQGNQNVTYDSREENSYDVEKRFAEHNAPVNAPFDISVQADGRISEVSNLDAVLKNYMRDDYKTTRAADLAGVKQSLADMKLKPLLQLLFQKLSDEPVAKDSTWTLVKPDNMGYLSYRSTGVYRVKDIVASPKGRLAHIDVGISALYTGQKKLDTGQGMATMDAFDVTGKGVTVFNMQYGRVQRRNLRTDVLVRMYIEPPEELKKLTQIENFWMTQTAYTEDRVEPYTATISSAKD